MVTCYHIGLDETVGARYAILPGDPGRVEQIAECLEDAHYLNDSREYRSYLGTVAGERVLVMSTGMGGPSTAIALEELAQIGVDTALRVGTCGGIDLKVKGGDLVIAQAAIRMEGTSREYLPIEFPACADFTLTAKLVEAASRSNVTFHIGVVHSKDSFYGQHNPGRMPVAYELEQKWSAWRKAHTLCSEMECSALFSVGQVLGLRCGAILKVIWNKDRCEAGLSDTEDFAVMPAIRTAIDALQLLIHQDRQQRVR